jgi:hypothetical protein
MALVYQEGSAMRFPAGLRGLFALGIALLPASPAWATQAKGHFDAITSEWVGGWAYDPDHPWAEIAIHVYVDGSFAADGVTSGYRPDVNAAFGLTGNHGFTIPVNYAAFGYGFHVVRVYAIDADGEGNPEIDGSPMTITVSCTPNCAGKVCGDDGCGGVCGTCPSGQFCAGDHCSGPPVGMLDDANTSWAGGWAYDPDHPGSEIAIHIYIDGQFATNGMTSGYRPDVNAQYGLSGNHGFTIPIDLTPYGPGNHQVWAYAIDSEGQGNPALPGSPKTVTVACTPSCAGKACGDDGCGGSCGTCPGGLPCVAGHCGGSASGPYGHLDQATPSGIAGWAQDPDWDGPIDVHIYVDGVHVKVVRADEWRADVGAHAFHWVPPPYGAGTHDVIAYALGVDASGALDEENLALDGSPIDLHATCAGLEADAYGWCTSLPDYWVTRQDDTEFVSNDSVRVGVNTSFGGTILQLYGPGWDQNLVLEHGGGAIQLSIWGYDPVGGTGWFATDGCDPTAYPSQAACQAAGHPTCTPWAYSGGAHKANCTSVTPCDGWTPGAPWNPIEAQGPGCGWLSPQNDCNAVSWQGDTLYTRLDAPFHFTSTAPPAPMPMEQWVTAHWGYVEIHYRLSYTGPYTWSPHPQEIPAIFAAPGMTAHFYYYGGAQPFAGDAPTHLTSPGGYLRYPNRTLYGHGDDFSGYAREGWWGVCDADEDRCITVASFSPLMNEAALQINQSGGSGYVTALGYFGVSPGMVQEWTIYVFPKRWDQLSGDKTVRQHIYDLAPPDFKAGSCVPNCSGKVCGDDGCGGSCGACWPQDLCLGGACVCQPDCQGLACGSDGCGGSCGDCGGGDVCVLGHCVCPPDCAGKACGPDGCGGLCGVCPGQGVCVGAQCVCEPACAGKVCGDDLCGGSCGTCAGQDACVNGACVCQPACAGKACGPDGCGGSCGACWPQDLCLGGACVCQPACAGKACGPDGCGGSCGVCAGAQDLCIDDHCVCQPDCFAKECGDDGCGGACGACGPGEVCILGACGTVPVVEPEPDVAEGGEDTAPGADAADIAGEVIPGEDAADVAGEVLPGEDAADVAAEVLPGEDATDLDGDSQVADGTADAATDSPSAADATDAADLAADRAPAADAADLAADLPPGSPDAAPSDGTTADLGLDRAPGPDASGGGDQGPPAGADTAAPPGSDAAGGEGKPEPSGGCASAPAPSSSAWLLLLAAALALRAARHRLRAT